MTARCEDRAGSDARSFSTVICCSNMLRITVLSELQCYGHYTQDQAPEDKTNNFAHQARVVYACICLMGTNTEYLDSHLPADFYSHPNTLQVSKQLAACCKAWNDGEILGHSHDALHWRPHPNMSSHTSGANAWSASTWPSSSGCAMRLLIIPLRGKSCACSC